MTNADPLPPTVLRRKVVVYVRQSAQSQVHLESQRRQYDLVDEARRHGFRDVEVGIICSSCATSSTPASSTSMASTIRVGRMTDCFWE